MPTEFGFTGEQTDSANDLVYLRARYLNPKLGVFGSLDPLEGQNNVVGSLNRYNWVRGNVVNLRDASGMSPCGGSFWDNVIRFSQQIQMMQRQATVTPTSAYNTSTPTSQFSPIPTQTPSATLTSTPTVTQIPTGYPTATPTYTPTLSATPTSSPTASSTPTPYQVTPSPTLSPTPVTPTATSTPILDPYVWLVGFRFDLSIKLPSLWFIPAGALGFDLNLEIQAAPENLSSQNAVVALMVTGGPQWAPGSVGIDGSLGFIAGRVKSSSIGTNSINTSTIGGSNINFGAPLSPIVPAVELDYSTNSTGWVGYLGAGINAGLNLPISIYGGTSDSVPLSSLINTSKAISDRWELMKWFMPPPFNIAFNNPYSMMFELAMRSSMLESNK